MRMPVAAVAAILLAFLPAAALQAQPEAVDLGISVQL